MEFEEWAVARQRCTVFAVVLRTSLFASMIALLAGCASMTGPVRHEITEIAFSDVPRELDKVTLPIYRVEPPDILLIEAVNNIRPANAKLQAGDQIIVRVANGLPINPDEDPVLNEFKLVNGIFLVGSNGTIDLGPLYGSVVVEGFTVEDAETAVKDYLKSEAIGLRAPEVSLSLPDVAGKQQITGEHLVRPDGTVSVGIYGSVSVAGLTLAEVKEHVEAHLSRFIHQPEVNVDVLAYNSKTIYVITDGGGFGEQVARLPVTGNETVLDAISQIQGLSQVSSKRIWVARPAPAGTGQSQILDVHWEAIVAEGITTTNYQLMPGDRIYIQADKMIAADNFIAKMIAPVERIMGVILLGSGVQSTLRFIHVNNRGRGGGF